MFYKKIPVSERLPQLNRYVTTIDEAGEHRVYKLTEYGWKMRDADGTDSPNNNLSITHWLEEAELSDLADYALKTTYVDSNDHPLFFALPNGKKCCIGVGDIDFFRQLQALPAETKVSLMCLTEEEILSYLEAKRKIENDHLIELLKRKWYWMDTGDPFDNNLTDVLPGGLSANVILKKCRSKKQLSLKEISKVVDFFESDFPELYNKE